ncbi:sigma-54 dependent transcriptional regulator [Alphaproteobacteria bacterium]|nr:sigma-54 dependent transcriptional regulator [Alphaproteobacteria bacterium]
MSHEILIVDDEADILELLSDILKDEGYTTRCALSGQEAIEAIAARQPHLIIQDIWLKDPQFDGLKVLEKVKETHPHIPMIMMSGHGTVETAVKATKSGAYDFLEKPFKAEKLLLLVTRALETAHLTRQLDTLRQEAHRAPPTLNGTSPAVEKLRQLTERVAPSNSRLLITGAPGTGKEMIARYIHKHSPRAQQPFMILNCAMLAPELFEETLFGAENSSGDVIKTGKLEHAHQGTLLLDEVLDLPLQTQAKLVRTLHDMRFQRVNRERWIDVDVRIMAATSGNIEDAIKEGHFREDLYYRLNVVPVIMPSLAERQEDIPQLIDAFMEQLAPRNNRTPCRMTDDAIEILQTTSWPGNVTQLRNVVEWILIMHANEKTTTVINPSQLPVGHVSKRTAGSDDTCAPDNLLKMPLKNAREAFERDYLLAQVKRFSGNISRTAHFIGMERSALHRKLKSLDVKRSG